MESCSKDKHKVENRSQFNIQHPHKTESGGPKYERIGHMHKRILRKCCIYHKIENVFIRNELSTHCHIILHLYSEFFLILRVLLIFKGRKTKDLRLNGKELGEICWLSFKKLKRNI